MSAKDKARSEGNMVTTFGIRGTLIVISYYLHDLLFILRL